MASALSPYILLLFFSHFLLIVHSSTNPDLESLISFKTLSDPSKKLTTWKTGTDPCTWTGVSCVKNRVTRLILENLDLQGSIEPLTSLTQLRVLSLKGNRFSGSVPSLSSFTSLKLLFLSNNRFSGEFPSTVTSLFRLYRLDLSSNNFSGEIPATVNRLTHLLTLRLNDNQFSGLIPELHLPSLQDFNVSGNVLSGEIPETLSGFSGSSFGENPFLCGAPLKKCEAEPNKPGSEGAIASPLVPRNRGPGRTPLDWTTRLKIAAGAAKGVTFIHNSCKSLKLTHGNIKSTNILLDKQGNARVSDFGLSIFNGPSPSGAGSRPNGYRAPEVLDGRKQSQKSDVYSFGVLLLEMLTGKCPSAAESGGSGYVGGVVDLPRWVQSVVREEWTAEVFDLELMRYKDIEEEMVGLLQIAMSCTAASPDQRPRMSHVVKMIEDLRGVEVSPCHDTVESVSDSPSLSEDACAGTVSQ
ncbi:hypothetical protein TSUD_50130 [Trifolium subterraneum]|uniref:Protein kinase domain-containing protein n=1 Tax=Trifolium subterraneum TaxID=3900 RepID=A0A2Z6LHU4_TRISU|nr:hypothetical protein TSUD_50130 [Trifolium subterraneum]